MAFTIATVLAVVQLCFLPLISAQFFDLTNGRVGVNFAGFHASAGLGGGNGGFLSADAGTPWGQGAAAGLGGGTSGGKLFAGATAGNGLSARAGLGGSLDGYESESGGNIVEVSRPRVKGIIYSEAEAPGTVAAEAVLGGKVVGEGSSGVLYTKTAAPSHVEHVRTHKTDHKVVTITDRYNDDGANDKVLVEVPKVSEEAKVGVEANLATKVVEVAPAREIIYTKRISARPLHRQRTKLRTKYISDDQNEDFGDRFGEPVVVSTVRPAHHRYKEVSHIYEDEVSPSVGLSSVSTPYSYGYGGNGRTIFDNIFNIPISTLKAVNNFLNQG